MADTAGKRRAGRADGAGRDKLKKKKPSKCASVTPFSRDQESWASYFKTLDKHW